MADIEEKYGQSGLDKAVNEIRREAVVKVTYRLITKT